MNNYKIFGNETVDIVIEMGLGACIAEWESLARELGKNYGVLVYERAGINHSDKSDRDRTPTNIAKELMNLLDKIPHDEKIVIIGHSQGGLYASEFCGIYPETVKGLILLDPLSIEDNRFKNELTAKELKRSGADKSKNFIILEILARLGLKGVVKKVMSQAPPFYYTNFSEEQKEDISEEAILENMEFGRNSRSFAVRIEQLWQEIMKVYLDYSERVIWMQAKKSTHYIHLTEPELIIESVNSLCPQ